MEMMEMMDMFLTQGEVAPPMLGRPEAAESGSLGYTEAPKPFGRHEQEGCCVIRIPCLSRIVHTLYVIFQSLQPALAHREKPVVVQMEFVAWG